MIQFQQTVALRSTSMTEKEMSAFNLDGTLPHSLSNPLPKALLPTPPCPAAPIPWDKSPCTTGLPASRYTAGSQLGTNISVPFCSCSSYFSPIWSAHYHWKTNQFSIYLLAAGVSPSHQLMWISVKTVHWALCHTSRESLWTLCLWLEFRKIPLPCPQHHLSGIAPLICDLCFSFMPRGTKGECWDVIHQAKLHL